MVLQRRWDVGTVLDARTHPFAVKAIVMHGDRPLTGDGSARQRRAAKRLALTRDAPHAERHGVDATTLHVAWRS